VIFRNIDSISTVLAESVEVQNRYLLPSISNLALIDSIIPGNIPCVFQMTVSQSHRGAINRMNEIHRELGSPEKVKMIFVVPEDVIANFTFPSDMPQYVEMYITVAKPLTPSHARKLISSSR
jgi:hypothetical protein